MDSGDRVAPSRVIYVAPVTSAGGVGHYADAFVAELRAQFDDVVEIRHRGPGGDPIADLRARRRELERLVDIPGRVVIHSEISGGSVESFWPTAYLERRHRRLRNTATVHDPPGMVWLPARTKFLSGRRLLSHGIHFPSRPLVRQLERTVAGDRDLFALSAIGARSMRERYPRAAIHQVPLFVPRADDIPSAPHRPRAVGMFGLVYRGKGFEHIAQIRESLDPGIDLRIAGRGTESLPRIDGVEIVGGLDGREVDHFFGSIRAMLVPYGRRTPYGQAYPASAAVAQGISFLTPVVSTAHGALEEMADDGGAVVVHADGADTPSAIATAAQDLVDDPAHLGRLVAELEVIREDRSPQNVVRRFADVWSR